MRSPGNFQVIFAVVLIKSGIGAFAEGKGGTSDMSGLLNETPVAGGGTPYPQEWHMGLPGD